MCDDLVCVCVWCVCVCVCAIDGLCAKRDEIPDMDRV